MNTKGTRRENAVILVKREGYRAAEKVGECCVLDKGRADNKTQLKENR